MFNGEERDAQPGAPSQKPHLSTREWLLLLTLAAVQFTHIVDFMIIMPLGPIYIREMGLTAQQFGFVVAAYTASAGVANLVAACLLDRFDRKTALLTCYAGFGCGTLLCAAAPDYPLLLAARIVAGDFGGVAAAVVLAIIGDVFHDAHRGTATGVVMSAFSVASIAGLPLGLYLADVLSWHAPFVVLGCLAGVVLLVGAMVLPPLRGHLTVRDQPVSTWAGIVGQLREFAQLALEPNHLWAFALMVAMMFTSFTIAPYLATYLVVNAGLPQDWLKYVYLTGGLATLVTLTPIGWVSDRFGKLGVFRILALLTIPPILLLTNLSAGWGLAVILVLTTAQMVTSSGRMVPAMAMITASAAPRQRGRFMSLNTAVQHLSAGLATAVGGILLQQPPQGGPVLGFGFVGLLASAATVLSVYLAGRLRRAPGGRWRRTR